MKKTPLLLFTILLLAFCYSDSFAQANTSNKGTDFWTCWMDHIDGTTSNMSLYITGDINTTGTVDFADGSTSKPFTVIASQVTIITIPTSVFLASSGQFTRGIHITSQENIVVYAHIYASHRSAASLVLPLNAMGKEYYTINYTQRTSNAYSAFCVIGTENNTAIDITPTAALTDGHVAGATFRITLQKGEIYQGLSSTDLTGTHIKSVSNGTEGCKKIAVYSGSSFAAIGCAPKSTADNLFQQAYPTASWGKNFVTAPLSGRNYDIFRIAYSDPTANVQLNGVSIPRSSLVNGFYYEFNSSTPNNITSDKPIQVAQFSVTMGSNADCSTNNENIGDPEMIFLTPIEQGLDHVSLYSTDKQDIVQSFINVIIPASAAGSFVLDGSSYASSFRPVPVNSNYSYAQIPVSAGTHNISASTAFNAIAYGFGNVESYGYSAGTDLKNLNEYITLRNPVTNAISSTGCTGLSYKPRLSIPYQTTNIKWDLKDGSTPVTDNNPTLVGTTPQGATTLYIYEYSGTVSYPASGSYAILATVFNPSADDCGSNEDIELDFNIADTPLPDFSKTDNCLGDPTTFTDKSDLRGSTAKSWLWDFGDGQTGNTATVSHTYAMAKDYNVTLTVTNQSDCSSTSAIQTVHIAVLPQAVFTVSPLDCETQDITFTDASTPGEGTLITRMLDFGDNTTPVQFNTATITHKYATANTYNAVLTVTNSLGCTAKLIIPVTVHPMPVADFILPDICLSDATAKFNDASTGAPLTYSWDFGDTEPGNVNAANPNTSSAQNPSHRYAKAQDYHVKQTVTSQYGCVNVKDVIFTVNGDNPTAGFVPDATNSYCSSDSVAFISTAHPSFGKLTMIKMYWDYSGDRSNFKIYYNKDGINNPTFKFKHFYGLFNSPLQPKKYDVMMEAYSGSATACVGVSAVQTISIKVNPKITITSPGGICQEAQPVQIAEDKHGFTGISTFTGPGIDVNGLFNPAAAGAGTFTINYSFTAANSCRYDTSVVITVYPTPKVSAGDNFTLLEGESKTIKAAASGTAPLTYKWTLADGGKATDLNRDDILQPSTSATDNISYTLTVISANGCRATADVAITVLKKPIVPNTFTPNNDGVNDSWNIKYLETYPNCTVDVYNRLGERLYSSIGYPVPWNGLYNGAALPVGTYYYIINPKSGRKVISGSVTIIR